MFFCKPNPLRRDGFIEPLVSRRFWKLNEPAYGFIDAPVNIYSVDSLKAVGLIYKRSSFDPFILLKIMWRLGFSSPTLMFFFGVAVCMASLRARGN